MHFFNFLTQIYDCLTHIFWNYLLIVLFSLEFLSIHELSSDLKIEKQEPQYSLLKYFCKVRI